MLYTDKKIKVCVSFILFQFLFTVNFLVWANPPSNYAVEILSEIKEAFNIPKDEIGIIADESVQNAMATTMPRQVGINPWGAPIYTSQKIIVYSPKFMTNLEITTGSKWAAISVLAHEVGHHICNHTSDTVKSSWQKELEADYYSGKALAKLKAPNAILQLAQRQLFSMWGNPTHPDTVQRIVAINKGYIDGGGIGENLNIIGKDTYSEIQAELKRW